LSFIHGILKDYVIHKGDQKFVMTCGQPQGGRLSSVLCDLYYSDLDRTQLGEFQNDEDLLLRAVDDYLFIATDLDRAIRYVVVVVVVVVFPRVKCQAFLHHLYQVGFIKY
jgi:hypothetical protein